MPQQVCNIFQRSAFHPYPAHIRVPQGEPPKVLDSRFNRSVVEPMPPIRERLPGLFRLEHTPLPVAPRVHNL
jgi:hypothetical protein